MPPDVCRHHPRQGNADPVLVGQDQALRRSPLQPAQPFLHELPQDDLHWQGKDPEADKEVVRETAESHMAKIAAMLARG